MRAYRRIGGLAALAATFVSACIEQPASIADALATPVITDEPPPTAETIPTPAPTATLPTTPPSGIILISVDGGREDWLTEWTADGTMPNLASLRERGSWGTIGGNGLASSLVAHHSLSTGHRPNRTGVVGDRVHLSE